MPRTMAIIAVAIVCLVIGVSLSSGRSHPNCASIGQRGYEFTQTHQPTLDNLVIADHLKWEYEHCITP